MAKWLTTIPRNMLAIVVNFEIKPGTDSVAIAALEGNASGSRTESGCLKWEWSRHVTETQKFAIYELYTDQAAIDFHRASPHFLTWQASLDSFLALKTSGIFEVTGVDPRPVSAS